MYILSWCNIMVRQVIISFRVKDTVKEKISMKTEEYGVSVSEYLRRLVLNDLEGKVKSK